MTESKPKSIEFSGDEFLKLADVAKPIYERGSVQNLPQLVIFMGGVGCGKTTIRRQEYPKGYVHFDFAEILSEIKKAYGEDEKRLSDYALLAADLILKQCIADKRNIVIEIIGDSMETLDPILDKMKGVGYETSVKYIQCDPVESYARHIKAVKDDPTYFSAFHSQDATMSFFFSYFGIPMPSGV